MSIHLGDKMRGSALRTRLKDIRRGNVVSGKKESSAPPAWAKLSPTVYELRRGAELLGSVEQQVDYSWFAYKGGSRTALDATHAGRVPHRTLAEAKAALEECLR